jgi:hypothetical protein
MTPQQIQLRRTTGWRMPPNTVNVARPSRWGNPHRVGWCDRCGAEHTLGEAIAEYRAEIEDCVPVLALEWLRGKNLACWCKPGHPCHADVLLEIANAPSKGPNA